MTATTSFPGMVAAIEQRLAGFYGFTPQAAAADHLLNEEQLRQALGAHAPSLGSLGRAAVFINPGDDELFIGVHFASSLVGGLVAHDPTQRLDDANLDAFCLLVEEISHFHLVLNRAAAGRPVSKLELEGQGEIDKLLVAALLLEHQCGDPHLLPLARRLYDGARIVSADYELYWQATRYAARFWFALAQAGLPPLRLRSLLREQYQRTWTAKLDALTTVAHLAA